MASFWYTTGLKECLDGTIDIDNDTLRIMLIGNDTTYTPDKDHTFVDMSGSNDPIDCELTVTGYTGGHGGAGRKVATIAVQANLTDDRVECVITDLTWTALGTGESIVGAILHKPGTSNDTDARLIAWLDVTDTPTNGGDITLDFNDSGAGGNLRVTT